MKCKFCGAEIANDSVYCEQCGKRLKMPWRIIVRCVGYLALLAWIVIAILALCMM